jgi:predicted P-loop ATPase
VFTGTTNEDEYLEDPTGNRRFLPLRVSDAEVDTAAIARDRDQLWAEARDRFRADLAAGGDGIEWADAERLARDVHAEFKVVDVWSESVAFWIDQREDPEKPFTVVEVLKGAILMSDAAMHQGHKDRMARILRAFGYKDSRPYVDGKQIRAWTKAELAVLSPEKSQDSTGQERQQETASDLNRCPF